jgi:hypothetical protein
MARGRLVYAIAVVGLGLSFARRSDPLILAFRLLFLRTGFFPAVQRNANVDQRATSTWEVSEGRPSASFPPSKKRNQTIFEGPKASAMFFIAKRPKILRSLKIIR